MDTNFKSAMQKIVFDIEKASLKIASKFDSSKPLFIALKSKLYDDLVNAGFIQNGNVLNGRYKVLKTDAIRDDWYLLFNESHLTKTNF